MAPGHEHVTLRSRVSHSRHPNHKASMETLNCRDNQAELNNLGPVMAQGCDSLVIKVTDSWPACNEFKPNATEDPPCRGFRCKLNMSRIRRLPVGVVWKLGERGASSSVVLLI
ncbi:hypothetical protein TNCV_3845821 [Trichonephila clavipes]|nr:hypothetical protein TNCV_3845821 [Trichonephila clavipes]